MRSWEVLEYDTIELAPLDIKRVWKRNFPGHFYLIKEKNRVLVISEEQIKLHGRRYLVNIKSELNILNGDLIKVKVPQRIPLYIKREDDLWIIERIEDGEVLWRREFQESEVNATCVGNLVIVSGVDKGHSCTYVFSSNSGELLWSLEKDYSADFFVTSVRDLSSTNVISVTWLDGLNNVTLTQGGRLIFLEVISDPFYEVEGEEKAVKDEIYAVDSVDGSILWKEVHDLIETRETPKGVIIETLDSQREIEKCIVKFISNNGRIAWLRKYSGYVRVFNTDDIVALEGDGTIEVISLTNGKRILLLSNSKRMGVTLSKLLNDKMVVEEYKPAKGRHALKAFDFNGKLLWEVYLSPESSTLIDLSDERFGAIYVRGYTYLIDLDSGKVTKAAKTGRIVALFMRYPFIIVARRGSPNTKIYDAISGTVILEFDEILRGEDILPINNYVLVQLENSLHGYYMKRSYVSCTYPKNVTCKRGELIRIEYNFTRVQKTAKLSFKKVPFMRNFNERVKVNEPKVVSLELKIPNNVPPGLYELVASTRAGRLSRKLITQLMVH